MLKIGLTGGIGSGKSIVSKVLEAMGHFVFNSDEESKMLMNQNPILVQKISELFGGEAYLNDELNRPFIANAIFANPELRAKMNSLVHPATREAFSEFCQRNNREKFVFNEAAILFETGAYETFDKMILVTAPEDIRIQRVMDRDKVSEESVRARMKAQWTDDEKQILADFVLINDDKSPLLVQIENVLSQLQ